jgi:hypothetical protein
MPSGKKVIRRLTIILLSAYCMVRVRGFTGLQNTGCISAACRRLCWWHGRTDGSSSTVQNPAILHARYLNTSITRPSLSLSPRPDRYLRLGGRGRWVMAKSYEIYSPDADADLLQRKHEGLPHNVCNLQPFSPIVSRNKLTNTAGNIGK